jgi:trans-aconitate methyltransferase
MAILYRSSLLYHGLMTAVYHVHRRERFREVAQWIPEGAEVLDVCCGDGALTGYLDRSVRYRGLDQSPVFVARARDRGREVEHFDLRRASLPGSQVVVCQASLFQFYPDVDEVLGQLFDAALQRLIVSESVKSLTQSRWSCLSRIVAWGTHVEGMTNDHFRFCPEGLDRLFHPYAAHLRHAREVCGGRDWLYVLDK